MRYDDLGSPHRTAGAVDRIVSLVPSLTETVAVSAPERLVGATDWCTHPAGLDVTRVGGTKWPDLDRIRALDPGFVLANAEENRVEDLDALRAAGIRVWVTAPATVPEAIDSLERMLDAMGIPLPGWIETAREVWSREPDPRLAGRRVVVPIWRRPWMVVGRDTFAGDVIRRLGLTNLYAEHADRYPKIPIERIRADAPDLVVLPDEPYAFSATDGPAEFGSIPSALVSGRHLTWYGPSLVEARAVLVDQLTRPVRSL